MPCRSACRVAACRRTALTSKPPPALRCNVGPPLAGGPCYSRAIMWPVRKTPRLRFARFTKPGANYFITFSTKNRAVVLTETATGRIIADSLHTLHRSGDVELLAATIMPDHVHCLFNLGERLDVGQVMGKLKTLARDHGRAPWKWQSDGFEHQVRSHESTEDYGFYIFMNPYRAGLCRLATPWPWWICPDSSIFRFLDAWQAGEAVPAAWLDRSDEIAKKIIAGE
jgi:putative transposase